jgi:hypothetical protein
MIKGESKEQMLLSAIGTYWSKNIILQKLSTIIFRQVFTKYLETVNPDKDIF